MQNGELLFAQNDERGVAQFDQFGSAEYERPETGDLAVRRGANRMMKAKKKKKMGELRSGFPRAQYAERGQTEIPDKQRLSQLERLSVGHQSLNQKRVSQSC